MIKNKLFNNTQKISNLLEGYCDKTLLKQYKKLWKSKKESEKTIEEIELHSQFISLFNDMFLLAYKIPTFPILRVKKANYLYNYKDLDEFKFLNYQKSSYGVEDVAMVSVQVFFNFFVFVYLILYSQM